MPKNGSSLDINAEMEEMLEHYRITKTLKEYCHGCDRVDLVRMASVYTEESWDDHGEAKMDGRKYAAHATSELLKISQMVFHQLGQTTINVSGDEAGAETYFICTLRAPGSGVENLYMMGGRYVDRLQRSDGKWMVKKRICVRDWSITLPIMEDFLKNSPYVQGSRTGNDPSFDVLGLKHSGQPAGPRT